MVRTEALMLQAFAVVSLVADAVVLARVGAAQAAGLGIAAVPGGLAQRRAAAALFLDVAPRGEVWHKEDQEHA